MTGSLGEIRLVLASVSEQLGSAYQHADVARARIDDAISVLDSLGEHSEPLVPPELLRAVAELADGLKSISRGVAAVADIDARL